MALVNKFNLMVFTEIHGRVSAHAHRALHASSRAQL